MGTSTKSPTPALARQTLIDWYQRNRARSKALFDLVSEEAYYERPIALRHPIVFYEGHLPAFAVNTLIKLALHQGGIDEHYEVLFARGIDPDSVDAVRNPTDHRTQLGTAMRMPCWMWLGCF